LAPAEEREPPREHPAALARRRSFGGARLIADLVVNG